MKGNNEDATLGSHKTTAVSNPQTFVNSNHLSLLSIATTAYESSQTFAKDAFQEYNFCFVALYLLVVVVAEKVYSHVCKSQNQKQHLHNFTFLRLRPKQAVTAKAGKELTKREQQHSWRV